MKNTTDTQKSTAGAGILAGSFVIAGAIVLASLVGGNPKEKPDETERRMESALLEAEYRDKIPLEEQYKAWLKAEGKGTN